MVRKENGFLHRIYISYITPLLASVTHRSRRAVREVERSGGPDRYAMYGVETSRTLDKCSAVAVEAIFETDCSRKWRGNMKLDRLWSIGIAAIVSVGLFAEEPAYAADEQVNCTLETLNGQYLVASHGMLTPPVPHFGIPAGAEPSITANAGYSLYNGDGTGEDFVTFTINGINANVPSPQPTQYPLNPDCTGTKTVLPTGPHFSIFVATDGSVITTVATEEGFSVSASGSRVRHSQSSQ